LYNNESIIYKDFAVRRST